MCDQCQFTEILSFAQNGYFNFAIILFDANGYRTVLNEVHTVGSITYTTLPGENETEQREEEIILFPVSCVCVEQFVKEEIGCVRGHLV